jgi:hypothetical protein
MTQTISVRRLHTVVPPVVTDPASAPFHFERPATDEVPPVQLVVSADGKSIESTASFPIPDDLAGQLAAHSGFAPPPPLQAVVREFGQPLSEAAETLLRLFMQEIGAAKDHGLRTSYDAITWRLADSPWGPVPNPPVSMEFSIGPIIGRFNAGTAAALQALLLARERPFMAFDHLREAFRSEDNRFAWIQAAAAAELGVKEALLRLEPRLHALLLEVPAPPVQKLYGAVLKAYGGESSSYKSDLQNGAERRNSILHRPDRQVVTSRQRSDYLHTVDKALRHLVILCRQRSGRPSETL